MLRFLLLLLLIPYSIASLANYNALRLDVSSGLDCIQGEYRSKQSGECEPCRDCGRYMYIRKECTPSQNTQCGWCGSKTIVKNDDFIVKCEPWTKHLSMFGELKKRIEEEMANEVEEEEYIEGDDILMDNFGQVHVVEIRSRESSPDDVVKHEDVYDDSSSEENMSDEIIPKTVEESDIGQEYDSQVQTEAIEDMPGKKLETANVKTIVVTAYRVNEDDYSDEDIYINGEDTYEVYNDSRFSSRIRILIVIMLSISLIMFFYSLCRLIQAVRRRKAQFNIPSAEYFSSEQTDMINRCAQKVPKDEGSGYVNKLYLVDEI